MAHRALRRVRYSVYPDGRHCLLYRVPHTVPYGAEPYKPDSSRHVGREAPYGIRHGARHAAPYGYGAPLMC